jgi:phosphoribosylglycinamide formyltransferase 2
MRKKILLLGSGELGKELVIALQRLGQYVIAVDSYAGAPAMQVAHEFEVINMLDAKSLDTVVEKHKPDLVVPEIEAIRTECFFEYEKKGIQVVPSAKAANYTMNRKLIRDLAAKELGIRTARYLYATEFEQFKSAILAIGIPCIVKPLMSSSGKGQSVVKTESDIERSWQYALEGSRGDVKEVIIEEFIHFQSEITLLTVTQKNGDTLFCAPIGHRQERGDYQESWQPAAVKDSDLKDAQDMAEKVTEALGGSGIWGVEFFLSEKGVYFSELSPRPHDTGMVTLAGTQNLNEFELHARAILGLPIPQIELLKNGVSAVILSSQSAENYPVFSGVEEALAEPKSDLKLFGKPTTRKYRRMGVSLVYDDIGTDMKQLRDKAFRLASKVVVD